MSKVLYLVTDHKLANVLDNNKKVIRLEVNLFLKNLEESIVANNEYNNKQILYMLNKSGKSFEDIIKLVKEYDQILYRGLKINSTYEVDLRTYAFLVILVCKYLTDLKFKTIIFHTGISHHMNFVIFEIAARILKLPQVFLYNLHPSNRLLPLVQVESIKDRRPLGVLVSEFNHELDIAEFQKSIHERIHPGVHTKPSKNIFSFALFSIRTALGEYIYKRRNLKNNSALLYKQNTYFIKDLKIAINQVRGLKYLQKKIKENKEYFIKNLAETADIGENNILFFGHLQPEATSFPEAWENSNLVDSIMKLREVGFEGNIYFKEHFASYTLAFSEGVLASRNPTRVGMYRTENFYQQLELLNCKFIDESDSKMYKIILDNSIVATLTGTIALERALEGKKTIVMGYPWFKKLSTIIDFRSSEFKNVFSEKRDPSKIYDSAQEAKDLYLSICNKKTLANPEINWIEFELELSRLLNNLDKYTKDNIYD